MMSLNFTKMHGLGNDFVVIDAINQSVNLDSDAIKFIANRHFGVGCDQLLLVESAEQSDADFRYRIFNSDGGEVEQCGNGARCFARFVREKGLTTKDVIAVDTHSGRIVLQIMADNQVRVDMGEPIFQPDLIPIVSPQQETVYNQVIEVDGESKSIKFFVVSIGNPHAVILVDDIDTALVSEIGSRLASLPFFPQGVNVGFMQVIDSEHIRLRVFERGVGETQACGTGACGAVVAGIMLGYLNTKVEVILLGGTLRVEWGGQNKAIMMTGPTESVFEGNIIL